MAVISGDFGIGPYTITYDGAALGLLEGVVRHQQNLMALPIRCSAYGQNIIDYVIQGGGCFPVFTLKEWNQNTLNAMHSFSASMGLMPLTGTLFSSFCNALVFTALPGTPAATEGPATRTYAYAALLPGHNVDITFGATERNIPIVMAVLPQQYSTIVGQPVYYIDT